MLTRADMTDRYRRQTALAAIGRDGQERLMASAVLIVGLGGLGCPVAMYLTGAGAGRIGLADADTVSVHNLHRQLLYDEASTGMRKTDAALARLSALSPHTRFDLYPDGLTQSNAAAVTVGYDLVVDCTDNFATRFLIDDTCAALGVPWIMGSVEGFAGMVTVMGLTRGCRYTDLFGVDRHDLEKRPPASGGVMGPAAGVIGSIQAAEAIKILCGMPSALDGRLMTVNMLDLTTSIIDII